MILFARAVARIVGFLLLVVLALAGLAAAVFCIGTGTTGLSLGSLARLLHLADLRDTVGLWLGQLEAPGAIAGVAALCGLGAMLLGLLLVVGVLVPRRERLVTLSDAEAGALAARRRPLAQIAQVLAEQGESVTEARARVRPRRRSGGRVSVRATRPHAVESDAVRREVEQRLSDLTGPFALSTSVQVRDDGAKVQ